MQGATGGSDEDPIRDSLCLYVAVYARLNYYGSIDRETNRDARRIHSTFSVLRYCFDIPNITNARARVLACTIGRGFTGFLPRYIPGRSTFR